MKHKVRSLYVRGFTLVELLVAVVIGLIVTLAVTSIVSVGETQRRSTTSTNDLGQSSSFAIYQLDRAIRSAGSALVQSANHGIFGCKLNVSSILPRSTAFPVPFKDNFLGGNPVNLRLAPVLIGKAMSDDDTSDVLVVMRGNGNAGGVPRRVTDPGDSTTIRLQNSHGFAVNDLLLVSQDGQTDCLMEQITAVDAAANPGVLTVGTNGNFYTAGTTTTLATLGSSTNSYITPLGNTSPSSVQFSMFGIGANNTLFGYDLLRTSNSDEPQALVDGVQELHALYGLDINNDGVLDKWVDPSGSGGGPSDFSIASVMTSPAKIRQIVAIRLALVLKGSAAEREAVTPNCDGDIASDETGCAPYRYFTGLADGGTPLERELDTSNATARKFRFRVVETTIPLVNMQLLPGAL